MLCPNAEIHYGRCGAARASRTYRRAFRPPLMLSACSPEGTRESLDGVPGLLVLLPRSLMTWWPTRTAIGSRCDETGFKFSRRRHTSSCSTCSLSQAYESSVPLQNATFLVQEKNKGAS